jgi:beta-1,4-mannosyl-glycoprotein beta-1,4-N-acetylglucosaminyltransferase
MIVDAFIFFNEKELVELRVKYLNDIVDYFLIIEADVTHTGKEKKWNFPEILNTSLKEFSNKIYYHQMKVDLKKAEAEKSPNYKGGTWGRSWRVDTMQRNFLKEAYNKLPPSNDIIIISDLDEIPSKDKISFIKSCDLKVIAPVTFNHALFYLDCNYLTLERWLGSIVITKELMDKYEPQVFRDLRNRISHFNDAGWSFSSFGGVKKVREKLEAFCHEEYNKEKYKNEAHINKCIETGSDLFYREFNKKKVNKSFFPKDLLKLMEENPTFYFGSKTTIK